MAHLFRSYLSYALRLVSVGMRFNSRQRGIVPEKEVVMARAVTRDGAAKLWSSPGKGK
jgi:hypothetical protein